MMLQGHNYSCKNSFFLPTCENCAAEEKKKLFVFCIIFEEKQSL